MVGSTALMGIYALLASSESTGRNLQKRDCSINFPAYEDDTCASMADSWSISEAQFLSYNPGAVCSALEIGKEYCVEWSGTLPALPEPPKTSSTPTPTPIPTPTTLSTVSSIKTISNAPVATCASSPAGVVTPSPIQTGMTCGCTKFYKIASGDGCWQIANDNGIPLDSFYAWNPANADCKSLFPGDNVCVAKDTSTTTTTVPVTVTKPTSTNNGVSTPLPTQPGMVSNCNKFHYIAKGVVCSQVISYQKITLDDFVKWNPTVGRDCTGMQAEVNVCVGVIGGSTTTTKPTVTTTAGNGIQTPQPTQPGMVENCKSFHFAAKGVVCSQLTSYNKITLADFVKWNSGVGADCRSMWADTYFCVGV